MLYIPLGRPILQEGRDEGRVLYIPLGRPILQEGRDEREG